MRKILHKILILLFVISIISLLLSYLSVYINPNTIWVISFFGLAFPVIILINLAFLLYWIYRKKRKLYIISIITIILGMSHITDFFQINMFSNSESEQEESFKILSYNVRLFDLYSWDNQFVKRNAIFDLIKNEKADIICLQEFYYDITGNFPTLDTLVELQDAKNYYVSDSQFKRNKHHFGMIIFSKYPIINNGDIRYGKSDNFTSFADIVIKNDTIRVYNNHLQSIRFDYSDYELMDDIDLKIDSNEIKSAKNITKLLKVAFEKRAAQAEQLAEHISNSPYKTIVAGDFNDTPISYAYNTIINAGLEDAFWESGFLISNTYVGKFPSFRIDYILHSKELESFNYNRIKEEYSDHYPITCEFIINSSVN